MKYFSFVNHDFFIVNTFFKTKFKNNINQAQRDIKIQRL